MNLSPAQKITVKTWLDANAVGLSETAAAALLNAVASPDYWAWRTKTDRGVIYERVVPAGDSSSGAQTVWSWQGFKAQSSPEQECWLEMFVTGGNFSLPQNRIGVENIFGQSGLSGANRIHIYNVVRRLVTVLEKLFVTAVPSPAANTGNDGVVGNRGKATNPDLLGIGSNGLAIEGVITAQEISNIIGGL